MPIYVVCMNEFESQIESFQRDYAKIIEQVGGVIVGLVPIVDGVLTCLLSGGHILLEGVPGTGKTLLVRTLADALNLSFSRIQFTPDLMPADITGTEILDPAAAGERRFRFEHGPIFANLVLADEINRATPKTQSALLEAMQENTVSVAGVSHNLPQPLMVLATQNPIEMEGTYPLPEAQLDRFLLKLVVPIPDVGQLVDILNRTTSTDVQSVEKVLDSTRIEQMKVIVRKVPVASNVTNYIARLVAATHQDSPDAPELVRKYVQYGSSPRGGQAIMLASKVAALRSGNPNVAFDDIAVTAGPALRHRLILNFEGQADAISPDDIISQTLDEIPRDPGK